MQRKHLATTIALALGAFLAVTPADLAAQRRRKNGVKVGYWKTRRDYSPGWVVHTTRHYQIQSQCGKVKAKRLGKHMEVMWRVYFKTFKPKSFWQGKEPIKLFKDRKEFLKYGAPPGAGAYFSPMEKEMVCYDTGRWTDEEGPNGPGSNKDGSRKKRPGPITGPKTGPRTGPKTGPKKDPKGGPGKPGKKPTKRRRRRRRPGGLGYNRWKMDLLGAAAHEGWHQFFHWMVVSWVPLPSWLNEGMGDYFYAARPIKVKGSRAVPAQVGRMNDMRLPIVRYAVKKGKHVPIPELLKYSKQDYYANPSVCYAQGWALCQFLQHHKSKNYREIIKKFVHTVKDDSNLDAVYKKVFGRIDVEKLGKEWEAWVLTLRMPGEDLEEEEEEVDGEESEDPKELLRRLLEEARRKKAAGDGGAGDGGDGDDDDSGKGD